MTRQEDDFEGLVSDADQREFKGWGFAFIEGRYEEARPRWDFRATVRDLLRSSQALLDLGTGGGGFLKSVGPLPWTTVVTEGYKAEHAAGAPQPQRTQWERRGDILRR